MAEESPYDFYSGGSLKLKGENVKKWASSQIVHDDPVNRTDTPPSAQEEEIEIEGGTRSSEGQREGRIAT